MKWRHSPTSPRDEQHRLSDRPRRRDRPRLGHGAHPSHSRRDCGEMTRAQASIIDRRVHAENRASWRVLERAGFRRVVAGYMTPDNPIDTAHHFIYRLDRAG